MPLRIVFFGTSSFAAELLSFLLEKHSIVAIVTRPDRPQGRSLRMSASPVKEKAPEGIALYQPEKASTSEFEAILREYDADLFVVVAYGEIIKQNLLSLPKKGCINVHASLLPKYRGAAPMQRCLMEGEKESGISIIEMTSVMDAGDVLDVEKVQIPLEMTFGELEAALLQAAKVSLARVLLAFERGNVKRQVQDLSLVTFAPKLRAVEEKICWDLPAEKIYNLIRSMSPYPGAYCEIGSEKKRMKIRKAVLESGFGKPGETLSFDKKGWVVACGEGSLRLLEVQIEGKKSLPVSEMIKGMREAPSLVF